MRPLFGDVDDRYREVDVEYDQFEKKKQKAISESAYEMAPNPDVNVQPGIMVLLEGLVLVHADVDPKTVQIRHGVHVELQKGDFTGIPAVLKEYLNRPISTSLLQEIKESIIQYFYKTEGRYIAVLIPVQEVTDGVVVIQVLTGTVGKITYKGQKWFSENSLSRSLKVKPGDPIEEPVLMDYMSWINRNPFRKMQMVLQPGDEKGETDIQFITQDRFPIRFYSGFDNTGFLPTGSLRVMGGMNWGNALKQGDLLSYQYTASTDFKQFQSQVVSYTDFLPWRHLLNLFGCYGSVTPDIKDFNTAGTTIQVSGRYIVPFFPYYGDFLQHVGGGFDWKYLTTNLFFIGDPDQDPGIPPNSIINISQFNLQYRLQRSWKNQVLAFNTDLFASVWKNWLPHQTTQEYEQLRDGSHVRYAYLRASVSHRYQFDAKWLFAFTFRGQIASCTLPTSEQFGLGGADTVRGYYEQQYVADNAVLFNFELYTPPFSLFKAKPNNFSFLAFFDYGYGRNYSYALPVFHAQNLVGIGPGFRYDIIPNMSLKMDYGFQLKAIAGDNRTGRFHFALVVSN